MTDRMRSGRWERIGVAARTARYLCAAWFVSWATCLPGQETAPTVLPRPPETVHIMLEFAVPWAVIPSGEGHRQFDRYPDESIEQWHRRHGLYVA